MMSLKEQKENQCVSKNDPQLDVNPYKLESNPKDSNEYECFRENICSSSILNSSFQNELDFKGGLLGTSIVKSTTDKTDISAKSDVSSVTLNPILTSKGFGNTLKLLENYLENKLDKNDSYSQLYISKRKSFTHLSRVELEHVVIERLLAILRNVPVKSFSEPKCNNCDIISTPFVEILFRFIEKLPHLSFDIKDDLAFFTKDGGDSHILYYACKSHTGKHHLKTIKNHNEVLCGNRVSQMTRAYDDIEAVTRLLEEKEKDLELTVQIGKELLTQNSALESRISELESELKAVNDERAQLIHEVQKKNELIGVLTDDTDDGSKTSTPTFCKSITLELLQKKINDLQDENKILKMEVTQLADETCVVEEQERQLMEDITTQLNCANKQSENLNLEVERQREENRLQHEQIIFLTARLSEAEMRLHQLTQDNEEHMSLLNITKENQNSLAQELIEFKQRYQEVLALLQESQELLRQQRKKAMPQVRSGLMSSVGMVVPDSLQSELMESSMYSENSLDSGISGDVLRSNDRFGRMNTSNLSSVYGSCQQSAVPPFKRVFETVRCANQYENTVPRIGLTPTVNSSGLRMTTMPLDSSMGGKTLSSESLASQSEESYPVQAIGVPGAPGAKDLEAALKRLTPAEILARRAMLSYAPAGTYTYDDQQNVQHPLGIRTPDSIMSTGSSGLSSSHISNQWRIPDKLQIVKPMEGSLTLHHWSRLATPTLSGLLEERPGVKIRGGRDLDDLGMQIYTLSDVEEDVNEELPRKQFEPTGCIYTYTTSTIMHPDDGVVNDLTFLSQSQMSSRMASTSTSRQPSCPVTPRGLSRKNSCSTFSVNLGLASMLNERGIKAVTPSALNTPAGPNFSPTVTPCNSPEGSPTRSMSPEPFFGGILSAGADLIRRKLIGVDIERQKQKVKLSRLERRALRSLKLVEKVESIGLENLITSQPNAISQLASGIVSRSASPMAQLTSLKNLHTNVNRNVDDISFSRQDIIGVLNKGLTGGGTAQIERCNDDNVEEIPQNLINNIKDRRTTSSSILSDATERMDNTDAQSHSSVNATHTFSNSRTKQLQRQKSRRNLKNGVAIQRPDLGTIGNGRVRPDLGRVSISSQGQNDETIRPVDISLRKENSNIENSSSTDNSACESQSLTQSFVGSISSLLFGRKGGWL